MSVLQINKPIVLFFVAVAKYLRTTWKRKVYFGSWAAHFMTARKQKQQDQERGPGTRWTLPKLVPSDLVPTMLRSLECPTFPNRPLNYTSINGWIYWWDHNPHTPVTFQNPHLWTWLHWGSNLQHLSLWGHILDPNHNMILLVIILAPSFHTNGNWGPLKVIFFEM